jgi:hypothetical protein
MNTALNVSMPTIGWAACAETNCWEDGEEEDRELSGDQAVPTTASQSGRDRQEGVGLAHLQK